MRRHTFQRWSIVLLLVARLIIGEFAHAMPHNAAAGHADAHADAVVAAQSHEPPCPDHAGKTAGARQPADSVGPTVAADNGAPQDTDCCNTAGCECLCVHISAIATPSLAVNFAFLDQGRAPVFADGLMQKRLSALFRPPA